jgi:hypothetical protein
MVVSNRPVAFDAVALVDAMHTMQFQPSQPCPRDILTIGGHRLYQFMSPPPLIRRNCILLTL